MLRSVLFRGVVAAVAVASLIKAPAIAQLDATGTYTVGVIGDVLLPMGTCTADVVQVGTAIDFDFDCVGGNFLIGSGTIDLATGSISGVTGTCDVSAPPPGAAEPFSAYGEFFGATFALYTTCGGVEATYFGSTCGNGILDPGEECEDGNFESGDCCSNACQAETGTVCDAATPQCTLALCDSSGVCVANAAPEPAGTACDTDSDQCSTVEACDGAGSCATTGTDLDCGKCASCDPAQGCVADWPEVKPDPEPGECRRAQSEKALLKNHFENDDKDTFRWKWAKGEGFSPIDWGSPTTSTEYTLCVYGQGSSSSRAVLGELTIPPGSGWSTGQGGFRYKDDVPGVGRLKMELRASASKPQIKVKLRGPGLGYPEDLDAPVTGPVQGGLVKLMADNGNCWASSMGVLRSSGAKGTKEVLKMKDCFPNFRKCR